MNKDDMVQKSQFACAFPNVHKWLREGGWIELGASGQLSSFARALDEGGMVWEGKRRYSTIENALKDMDKGIAQWLREQS